MGVVADGALVVAGVAITFAVLDSALRTFVLPRGSRTTLTRAVFVAVRGVFGLVVRSERLELRVPRDRAMALYAPVGLLALVFVWMTMVMIAYMLMFRALSVDTWEEAFRLSGSSFFTLGFVSPPNNTLSYALAFTEAGAGLGLLALLIAYLPTIYNAELEETHTSLAVLSFFRSPQPDRSWVTAAGAVLDGASLYNSVMAVPFSPNAGACVRGGFGALRAIATYYDIPFDPDPAPTDPISIAREEFDEACRLFEDAHLPMRDDRDQAWRDFQGWRVNYDSVLLALAGLTMAPYAPWSSDRSMRYRPRLVGRRGPRPAS